MQRGARFSKRHTTPIAIRGLAFRSGNWKLRGFECVRALRGRWERCTRNNLSRNSDGKRENSGREQWRGDWRRPGYPLSEKCSCQIPLFINFPSGTRAGPTANLVCIPDFPFHRCQDRLDRPRIRENMRLNMLLLRFENLCRCQRGAGNRIISRNFAVRSRICGIHFSS